MIGLSRQIIAVYNEMAKNRYNAQKFKLNIIKNNNKKQIALVALGRYNVIYRCKSLHESSKQSKERI